MSLFNEKEGVNPNHESDECYHFVLKYLPMDSVSTIFTLDMVATETKCDRYLNAHRLRCEAPG